MARQIIQTDATLCDWHLARPDDAEVAAGHERTLENGKQVDLCSNCAFIFDVYYPRREEILAMLQPGVIEAFYNSARNAQPSTRRVPQQLLPAIAHQPAPEAAGEPKTTSKKKQGRRGVWKDDVLQVRCPLPHRAGSPRKYWVDLRNRTGHARMHKKGNGESYFGPDIAFELQPDERFTHYCTDHQVCAENGGYGFPSEISLTAHTSKSKDWPKATQEAKDAAETRLKEQAAA